MRERLWSQRMLALYRSGRQAEALRVFQDLRTILVAELGIEPGHDVTWMEHAILDPGARPSTSPRPPSARPGRRRPRHPRSTSAPAYRVRVPASPNEGPLVGRERESALLRDWWASVRRGRRAAPARRRRARHREDPPGGRAGACRRGGRRAGAVGSLRRGARRTRSSPSPRRSAGTSSRSRPTGSRTCRTGSSRSSPASCCACASTRRCLEEEAGDPESERFRFFEAVTATLQRAVVGRHRAPRRRRPALGRPADAAAAAPRAAEHRRRQARHHRDVHRHGGATGPPAALHAGGLPGGRPRRDRAPAGTEPGGGGGAGAAAGRRLRPDLVPRAVPADRRQPALPRRDAAAAALPRGRAGEERRRSRAARPQPDPRPSASWWPGASRGCPRT